MNYLYIYFSVIALVRPKLGTWDKGVEFSKIRQKIIRIIRQKRREQDKLNARKTLYYLSVLLIQLYNASRIGEAVEASILFWRRRSRRCYVRVEKHRSRKDQRLMLMPSAITHSDLAYLGEIRLDGDAVARLKQRIIVYARDTLGVNTHSLRYAGITALIEEGVPPAEIAKITGHKNLNLIINYTQRMEAEKKLEEFVE